uniref:Uncharacterized protein n=1 Tax=Aegilops tauschii TaxID=37682 RepID=R7VZD2_AEGTA
MEGGGGGRLLLRVLIVCAGALMMAVAEADAGGGDSSVVVVVGMAQCAGCGRKSLRAEAAFKGLMVAITVRDAHAGVCSARVRDADAGIRSAHGACVRDADAGLPSRSGAGVRDAVAGVRSPHGARVRDSGAEMHVHPYSGAGMPMSFPDAGVRNSIAELPVHPDPGARMPVPNSNPHAGLRGAADAGAPSSHAGVRSTDGARVRYSIAEMLVHADPGTGVRVPCSHPHAGLRDANTNACCSGVPTAGAGIRSAAGARVPARVRHAHLHSPGPPLAPSMHGSSLTLLVWYILRGIKGCETD